MNIKKQIKRISNRHAELAVLFLAEDDIEKAITHRAFSHELQSLIIATPVHPAPIWHECPTCGRLNHFDRNYCECGTRIDLF